MEEATAALLQLAPRAFLVTPSFPGETSALLDCATPVEAAARLGSLGARNVAVTCGADGIQLDGEGQDKTWISSIPAPAVVDQTGAGDAFVGTLTARMVLGDSLPDAARYGAAAASLVVGGKGGTGFIPTLEQTRAHASIRLAPEGAAPSHA
ncbi:sugar/nucleoside kinase (ribokinase family) [Pseudarthrobacter sp. SLBN-100]|uniref:carbohydrate kinase family protein n=1 Tax=Arthrobacter sp. SLBN-100 TaxID=2768450 RepID=UPI001F1D52AB|nr:carbohydrate kinase family protein [Arthrobacter sp. SLBN-100]